MDETAQEFVETLTRCFADLEDPRVQASCEHQLIDILAITLLAVSCGADDWTDLETFGRMRHDWLGTFLELPGGIPSHDTFQRVMSLLERQQFAACLFQWTQAIHEATGGKVIAIDGKALRSARSPTGSTTVVREEVRQGHAASRDRVRRARRQARRGPARVVSRWDKSPVRRSRTRSRPSPNCSSCSPSKAAR